MAIDQRVRVKGSDAWERALSAMAVRVAVATSRATRDAGRHLVRTTTARLNLYSHAPGTPTPSPPGGPPARVSGDLMRSIRQEPTVRRQRGVYSTRVGPTAVQSRAQERGYAPGHLPARPFLKPATRDELATIRRTYVQHWREATKA